MYCEINLDSANIIMLGNGDSKELICPTCGALWKFWVSVQLNHKLISGGKFNKLNSRTKTVTHDTDLPARNLQQVLPPINQETFRS